MVADTAADMKVHMVAGMEVDKVVDKKRKKKMLFADMLLHMVADKVAGMVADMGAGMVADKVAGMVTDMAADKK